MINKFEVFNMKSIPRTCNASIDMFKHMVRLEHHSDLRDIIEKPWTYKTTSKDIKSLWRKKHRILFSPNPLVKIKINKLLAARIIVSVHAWKGWNVTLKTIRCQLNDDILYLVRSFLEPEVMIYLTACGYLFFVTLCTYAFLLYFISCIILYSQ